MRGLTKSRKGTIGITAVTAVLALVIAVMAVSLAGQSGPLAQAHDDGTLHIHPTPTPTPLPPLGLNGPLSLGTGIVYQGQQHRLVVTSVVNNPPPEGWHFANGYVNVHVNYKGWNFSTDGNYHDDHGRVTFQDDVLKASLPLPEYVDFNQLTEPMIAHVGSSVRYYNDRGQDDMELYETMFVDLRDRGNWRE